VELRFGDVHQLRFARLLKASRAFRNRNYSITQHGFMRHIVASTFEWPSILLRCLLKLALTPIT
jgi:hypothetical protein